MADPPRYEQVLDTSLFVMARGPADVGWAAYLVAEGDKPPQKPISVADGLQVYNGHFLFALTPPALTTAPEVAHFVSAVYDWLNQSFGPPQPTFGGSALVWIPDAATPAFGNPSSYAFTIQAVSTTSWTLASDLNNTIGRRLTASMPNGTGIAVGANGGSLVFTGSGVNLGTTDPGHAPTVDPARAELPVLGPYSGCLLLRGALTPAATFAYFETGVRYSHPSDSGVKSQTYPVVSSASQKPILYTAALDPLDPTNVGPTVDHVAGRMRTLFAPLATKGEPPFLDAWLRTATGVGTKIGPIGGAAPDGSPQPGAGAFVLEREGAADDEGSTVYMTLAGDWAVEVAGASGEGTGAAGAYELLCGVNGLERLAFRSYSKGSVYDRLRFVPGRAAYAPRFPFKDASIASLASGKDLLSASRHTSWVTVHSPDSSEVDYLAQPASSPLYEVVPAATGVGATTTIFDWLPTSAQLPQDATFAVPFAPYAGVQKASTKFPDGELPLFETQVLAPTRKGLVSPSSRARLHAAKAARLRADAVEETSTTATTPQGFVVDLIGQSYSTVTLAHSSGPDLALANVTPQMQDLLQTNQLFAVMVDPTYVGAPTTTALRAQADPPVFQDTVTMSQWELAAPVGRDSTATDYHNVLILKFVDGTLEDRVSTPEKWIDPTDFSLLPSQPETPPDVRMSGLSQWLREYIAAALAEADAGNPLYTDFATVARDDKWNGFLVLKADVAALPPQLEGLMAGIDKTQLNAHHFGATVTPITPGANGPTVGLSSLFGLIDYQLPQYRQNIAAGAGPDVPLGLPVEGPYGFTVLQLQALFRNAALVDFRSRIQLTVKQMFGSPVTAAYGSTGRAPATGVVLRGSYQSQGGKDAYVFEQDATTLFTLNDGALQAVAVTRAQFDTLGETGSGADATTSSRFLMWGNLDFAALVDGGKEPFDALSFGSAPGTEPAQLGQGLSFSNLKIDMSFPTATPHATTFAFDASGLAFDLATSTPRDGSMFDSLELQLDSFRAAPAGKRPSDYGYLTVGSPLNLASFDGLWFGVVYKLTLGSPGALVAKAGFESRLLVGWAPSPPVAGSSGTGPTYSVVAGILLPGAAPGAKLISLQGVLKLSIDSIQLLRQEVVGHPGQEAFVLQLRGVGLKFLGVAKLPPGATIDFFLFGALEASGSLGWYAAYRKDQATQEVAALDPAPRMEALP